MNQTKPWARKALTTHNALNLSAWSAPSLRRIRSFLVQVVRTILVVRLVQAFIRLKAKPDLVTGMSGAMC